MGEGNKQPKPVTQFPPISSSKEISALKLSHEVTTSCAPSLQGLRYKADQPHLRRAGAHLPLGINQLFLSTHLYS